MGETRRHEITTHLYSTCMIHGKITSNKDAIVLSLIVRVHAQLGRYCTGQPGNRPPGCLTWSDSEPGTLKVFQGVPYYAQGSSVHPINRKPHSVLGTLHRCRLPTSILPTLGCSNDEKRHQRSPAFRHSSIFDSTLSSPAGLRRCMKGEWEEEEEEEGCGC